MKHKGASLGLEGYLVRGMNTTLVGLRAWPGLVLKRSLFDGEEKREAIGDDGDRGERGS